MNLVMEMQSAGLPRSVASIVELQLSGKGDDLSLVTEKLGGHGESYAVRADDFPILKQAATIIAGALSTSLVGWAPGAIAGLVILLYEYRQKRVYLTAQQAAIVRELKRHPGATVAELVEAIDSKDIDAETVRAELTTLAELRREDGVKICLASSDAQGRWRVEGF